METNDGFISYMTKLITRLKLLTELFGRRDYFLRYASGKLDRRWATRQDAEDIVQDASLALLKSNADFALIQNQDAYLRTVVTNATTRFAECYLRQHVPLPIDPADQSNGLLADLIM